MQRVTIKYLKDEDRSERIRCNIHDTLRRKDWLAHLIPKASGGEVGIICGGPSLGSFVEDIRQRQRGGMKLLATNGAHDYLVEKKIQPDFAASMDHRAENAAFYKTPGAGTIYLIASRCHPLVYEALEGMDVRVWHAKAYDEADAEEAILGPDVNMIGGGSTIGSRALYIAMLMGFKRFHFFGLDSCLLGDEHHAYPQPWNDGKRVLRVLIGPDPGGLVFYCHEWMVAQYEEMRRIFQKIHGGETPEVEDIQVHGPGLIAEMLRHDIEAVPA